MLSLIRGLRKKEKYLLGTQLEAWRPRTTHKQSSMGTVENKH